MAQVTESMYIKRSLSSSVNAEGGAITLTTTCARVVYEHTRAYPYDIVVLVPSTSVPGSLFLDVLLFCSVDAIYNLSHQLLCFIMLSYCSHFIIVYNYVFVIM